MQRKHIHEQAIEGITQVATTCQFKSRLFVLLLLLLRVAVSTSSRAFNYCYHPSRNNFSTRATTSTTFNARARYYFYHSSCRTYSYHDHHSRFAPLFCRCRAAAYRHHVAVCSRCFFISSFPQEQTERGVREAPYFFACDCSRSHSKRSRETYTHTDTETHIQTLRHRDQHMF